MAKNEIMTEEQFKSAVFDWNKSRNEFKLDGELEISMLKEEGKEFFIDSKTKADKLDALVDYEFAFFGTQMKISANFSPIDPMLSMLCQETIDMMKNVVAGELGVSLDEFEEIHGMARKIVVDCNVLKGKDKHDNGKIKKPKNLPNATELIAQMLENL